MNLQNVNRSLLGSLLVSGVLGVAAQAHALDLTPASAGAFTSLINSELTEAQVQAIVGTTTDLGLVYKIDYPNQESGNAAGHYATNFTLDGPGDASGATIAWNGDNDGLIACPECYLVVKDGNHTPNQYLFDIGSWNGTDTINLSGFWEDPAQGAISNIAIWNNANPGGGGGGTVTPIPEAETYAMMLAGLGLVGFMARRRLG